MWLGLAPSTRSTYSSALFTYKKFCAFRLLHYCLPATPTTLIEWAADCGRRRLHPKTIKANITALRSAHIDYGLGTIDAFSDPRLQRVISGIKRDIGGLDTKERLPITKEVLIKCLRTLDRASLYGATIYAAFCLAFAGFLRVGEITYSSTDLTTNFGDYHVTRRSLRLHKDHVELFLPSSKTDPFRCGVNLLIAAADDEACPVRALKHLTDTYPGPPQAPLFWTGHKPFTRDVMVRALKTALQKNGVAGHYSGHSFRRGAATTARQKGLSDSDIQLLGRWKSDAYRLYIDTDSAYILEASTRLQK